MSRHAHRGALAVVTPPVPPPTVAVCILTLQRPTGLTQSLRGVAALEVTGLEVHVVVVDNDPAGSARATVDGLRDEVPHPIRYVIEERRGIPFGRNRAVREARGLGADLLAFVDDDEVPTPRWLAELVACRDAHGADAVMGPVLPEFEAPPPAWVVQGRFFERDRRPTGTPMTFGTTSNVLVGMDVFGDEETPFAEWLGLTGGDDTHFFHRALLAGRRIVWCDEAPVVETVPPSRVDARWLVRRRYRVGNTLSLCLLDLEDSWPRRLRRAAGASGRVLRGGLLALLGLARGRAAVVAGLQVAAYGVGQLTGLTGRHYDEYRVIHGR